MPLPVRPLRLIGEPRDVSIARAYLRRVLDSSGVSGAGDDAATVLSELITDALLRGRSPILVSASVNNDEITLVVDDAAPAVPRQPEATHREERNDRHAA